MFRGRYRLSYARNASLLQRMYKLLPCACIHKQHICVLQRWSQQTMRRGNPLMPSIRHIITKRKIAQVPMLRKVPWLILGNQASQSLYLCLLPTPHQAPSRGKRSGRYWTASLSHRPCLPSPVPSQPVLEESSKDQGELKSEVLCGLNSENFLVDLYRTRCEPCWRVAGLL